MASVQENSNAEIAEDESNWWEDFVENQYPSQECLKHFKCSRETYLFLVKFLKPYIAPKIGKSDLDIYLRKGISVEKQVAILLFKLTSCTDYIEISNKFKIHKTTIHKIIYKGVLALNKYLLHDTICMPKEDEAEMISKDFECVYKIPQVIGVMNIVHIPITSPIFLNYKFLNSLLYPSFILQSVIDSNCLFRDVSVRHAGAADPQTILSDSHIYKYSKKVVPNEKRNISGTNISYKIVGPTEGPLYSWLLNNYDSVLTDSESFFNKQLDEIRCYSDSVITKLRTRFLILSHMMDLSYKVAPQVIAACCIIHNICEKNEDPFLDEWLTDSIEMLKKYPQPEMKGEWSEPEREVLQERDALKDYVFNSEIHIELTDDILDSVLQQGILDV